MINKVLNLFVVFQILFLNIHSFAFESSIKRSVDQVSNLSPMSTVAYAKKLVAPMKEKSINLLVGIAEDFDAELPTLEESYQMQH